VKVCFNANICKAVNLLGSDSGMYVHERWGKHTVVSEGSRVEVSFSIIISLIAKDLLALQAVGAVSAALLLWLVCCRAHTPDETYISEITRTSPVANLELSDCASNFLDYSNAFVTKCGAIWDVVNVGSAKT
jgi:hypothetical protein